MDLNDYLTLVAGKMREVCFPKALHYGPGKTGDFAIETGQF